MNFDMIDRTCPLFATQVHQPPQMQVGAMLTPDGKFQILSYGCACPVSEHSFLTVKHILGTHQQFQISVGDQLLPVTVEAQDPDHDLALVRLAKDATLAVYAPPIFVESKALKLGDELSGAGLVFSDTGGTSLTTYFRQAYVAGRVHNGLIPIGTHALQGTSGATFFKKGRKIQPVGVFSLVSFQAASHPNSAAMVPSGIAYLIAGETVNKFLAANLRT